jgi:translation initiation factor 1
MKYSSGNDGLVYSTDSGRMCPDCNNPVDQCNCGSDGEIYQSDGIVRVSRETKGRRGKAVTIIDGAPLDKSGLKKLAKELKQKCSSGGTVKDGRIEIQGDHRDKLINELKARGWDVKSAGGC